MDQEMYHLVSDLAAVNQMLHALRLQKPKFRELGIDDAKKEKRPAWWTLAQLSTRNNIPKRSSIWGLAPLVEPLERFRMPKGKKDLDWLARAEQCRANLDSLWDKARQGYEKAYRASRISQEDIEPQLNMMRLPRSAEHRSSLVVERQHILDTATINEKVNSQEDQPPIPNFGSLTMLEKPSTLQQTFISKVKTRPQQLSSTRSSPERKMNESSLKAKLSQPLVLYTFKPKSIALEVLSLMYPDTDAKCSKRTIDWVNFVSMMASLGFDAEHRSGSNFTFRGSIKVSAKAPESYIEVQRRCINVHRPHPSSEMSPILLKSLGRRFLRRFGWEKENFAESK